MIPTTENLRIAFLGTFHPAVPTFRALAERGLIAITVLPEEAGYKNDELRRLIDEFSIPWSFEIADIDRYRPNLILAANYPKLVPARYLTSVPCINTHWSLLPRWRGVHPTAWAVINGDAQVGLSVHLMSPEFDVGPILAQDAITPTPEMNLDEIHVQLAHRQAACVTEVLDNFIKTGRLVQKAQNETEATYVPQRIPEDGIVHWDWPTNRIEGLVKALPLPKYPGAFSYFGTRKVIIVKARAVECPPYFSTPGQVVRVMRDGAVWVKTGDTCLAVEEIMFAEEGIIKPAARGLKRGVKLGYDPQLEIARLKQQTSQLQEQMDHLVALIQGQQ